MKSRDIGYRISEFGGALACITYPVSVSVSQLGLALAVLGWIAHSWRSGRVRDVPDELRLRWHPVLLAGLGIYAVQFVSLVANAIMGDALFSETMLRGLRGELKDLIIFPAALWAYAYARQSERRAKMERWLFVGIVVLIVTGLLSIWSPYRLGKLPQFIANDFQVGPDTRFQHHLGTLIDSPPVHFYMPIGLMNTHLTYAGMILLVFPFLSLRVLDPFLKDPVQFLRSPGQYGKIALLGAAALLLLLNNGRSAILGLGIATLVAIIVFTIQKWKKRALIFVPMVLTLVAGVGLLYATSDSMHYRFARIVQSLTGQAKHTDSHRTLVWYGTLQLVKENPVVGIGPGQYGPEIDKKLVEISQRDPTLWLPFELAQRGHAHSDPLHFLVMAGPLALVFYLLLFGIYIYRIYPVADHQEANYWKWGPIGLLFAGLLQCYLQDDEILLPFWLLVGFVLASISEKKDSTDYRDASA